MIELSSHGRRRSACLRGAAALRLRATPRRQRGGSCSREMAPKRGFPAPPDSEQAEACARAAADRLSAMPDCILHRVMSFLKARQAVQTCVLSKRWEQLWSSMTCLDIDHREFPDTADDFDYCEFSDPAEQVDFDRFADFTNNLLMFHGAPCLETFSFRLPVRDQIPRRDVERWIRRGIKYCPSVLEIAISPYLFCNHVIHCPNLGSSSYRLTRLHLVGVCLDDSFATHLSSGCPVLKDLELRGCIFEFHEMTSRTIKNLVMDSCGSQRRCQPMIITAPSLASLHLSQSSLFHACRSGIFVTETVSIVTASIHVSSCTPYFIRRVMCKLLGSLNNVKTLEISDSYIPDMLYEESDTIFPTFHNLRTLLFTGCRMLEDIHLLWHFLRNAPVLEKLTLRCCQFPKYSKRRKGQAKSSMTSLEQKELMNFDCMNLKLIEIQHEDDNVHELFDVLSDIWSNLGGATIKVTKVARSSRRGEDLD